MLKHFLVIGAVTIIVTLVSSCGKTDPTAASSATPVSPAETAFLPEATPEPTLSGVASVTTETDPFALISQESLFAFLEDLTAIQAYSGWRSSASEGEAQALDYVAARLGEFEYLKDLGLALERQDFHVFLGTELWETRLHLNLDGREVEVPADGLRAPIDDVTLALRFDSDGELNDAERNPVVVEGDVVLIRAVSDIQALSQDDLLGAVVFLDYATIDGSLHRGATAAIVEQLLTKSPAGLVLVTQFSNEPGESHGFTVGDWSAYQWAKKEPGLPILYVRLEDLTPAGITSWEDLAHAQMARLTWDVDVFSPANSGNLVARIPGTDSSEAVILGAHIDSPNSPGAMDDGSGSVALLEVARVLDAAQVRPAVDLYLAWFGSEELMVYGSSYFVATHQELLDRTLAMLQIDCLTRPLDGISADLNLVTWSYGWLGDDRLTWPDYLTQAAAQRRIEVLPVDRDEFFADNSAFGGFDVPNADLIYMNEPAMDAAGGIHYAGHLHDPYDTVKLAQEVGEVLEQMAQVALVAALETGRERPALRVVPAPDRRALFVGSHTEATEMVTTIFVELGMTLAWEGFDVDWLPYGQSVTPTDLADVDLAIVFPVLDYPSPIGNPSVYDEGWSQEEIAALQAYVAEGGLLVLTNSAHRIQLTSALVEPNEDWSDANALATRFGISYQEGNLRGIVRPIAGHPLMEGVSLFSLDQTNGVPFTMEQGEALVETGFGPVVGLVDYGDAGGQVLVLADVTILGSKVIGRGYAPVNLNFWQNLARYARTR